MSDFILFQGKHIINRNRVVDATYREEANSDDGEIMSYIVIQYDTDKTKTIPLKKPDTAYKSFQALCHQLNNNVKPQ